MNEKLKITPLPPSKLKEIAVMFNPNSYSIEKSVSWDSSGGASAGATQRKFNAPALTFGGGGSRTLSLELFYDVTESGDRSKDLESAASPVAEGPGQAAAEHADHCDRDHPAWWHAGG